MAMLEEQRVMAAIGLGQHYLWFNGSGSCRGLRVDAARRIAGALQDDPDCADPDDELVGLVMDVAQYGETSDFSLTKTWVVASDVIQAHVHRKASGPAGNESWQRVKESIITSYRPRRSLPRFDSRGHLRPLMAGDRYKPAIYDWGAEPPREARTKK